MTNKEILKKQIIYRSIHRGSKEMDILLGDFVKKYIDEFNYKDLVDLEKILFIEDEIIFLKGSKIGSVRLNIILAYLL